MAKVEVQQPLSDQGLDSLMSTELFAHIEKTFGQALPLATLIEAPTIKQLAGVLASVLSQEVKTAVSSVSWSSLVEIQPGDSKPPLFFIHAEEGNVLFYRDLAHRLGIDQPFYGLQARGLNGEQVDDYRIEDMAAHYIKEIQSVQPHGPYFLGGFCLGGAIAYEMSQQLQADNDEVALLVMIQNYHRDYKVYQSNGSSLPPIAYRLIDRVDYELSKLKNQDLKGKLSYISKRIQRAIAIVDFNVTKRLDQNLAKYHLSVPHSQSYNFDFVADRNKDAFLNYEPRMYNGHVIIFRASKQPRGIKFEPTLGWGKLIQGEVELYEIDAYHQTIMENPQVEPLADILKKSLNKELDSDSS